MPVDSSAKIRASGQKKESFLKAFSLWGGVIVVAIAIYWLAIWLLTCTTEPNLIGDSFAVLNTLFTGLAFVALVLTLRLQQQDLDLTHQELQASTQAHRDNVKVQNELREIQHATYLAQLRSTLGALYTNLGQLEVDPERVEEAGKVASMVTVVEAQVAEVQELIDRHEAWSDFRLSMTHDVIAHAEQILADEQALSLAELASRLKDYVTGHSEWVEALDVEILTVEPVEIDEFVVNAAYSAFSRQQLVTPKIEEELPTLRPTPRRSTPKTEGQRADFRFKITRRDGKQGILITNNGPSPAFEVSLSVASTRKGHPRRRENVLHGDQSNALTSTELGSGDSVFVQFTGFSAPPGTFLPYKIKWRDEVGEHEADGLVQ